MRLVRLPDLTTGSPRLARCAATIVVSMSISASLRGGEKPSAARPAPSAPQVVAPREPDATPIDFSEIQRVVDRHFAAIPRKPGMLISKSDVVPALEQLRALGWAVPDEPQLLQKILDDGHFLVQQLRSSRGQAFAAKVASEDLIYDRLQRISEERGGQQLIRDLIKLPDAEKYAKKKTARAVPDLVDFLPKDASGTTRKVKDYDRPTGRIYTQDALLKQLAELHRQSLATEKPPERPLKQQTGKLPAKQQPTKNLAH